MVFAPRALRRIGRARSTHPLARGVAMKSSIIAFAVASVLAFGAASAAPAAAPAAAAPAAKKPMTAQQQKMADCSKANKGKKGDEYKAAQKACLSAKSDAAAPAA